MEKKTMGKKALLFCCIFLCLALHALARGQQPKLVRVLKGHRDLVSNLVFSPDGRLLASVGDNIRLWDTTTGRMVRPLYDGPTHCSSMVFSPDGKMLATDDMGSQMDRVIWVWDVATWKKIHSLRTKTSAYEQPYRVAFQPDGKTLVSAHYDPRLDYRIIFWDLATGKIARIVKINTGKVQPRLCPFRTFSSDCRLFAMTHAIGAKESDLIWLYETATGKRLVTIKGKPDQAYDCTFSPNGKMIAAAIGDATVRLWEVATGKLIAVFKGPKSPWPVSAMAFSPDSKTLAFGVDFPGEKPGIELWDVATGKKRASFRISPHDRIGATCMSFSPDGRILAVGRAGHEEWDETIELWGGMGVNP